MIQLGSFFKYRIFQTRLNIEETNDWNDYRNNVFNLGAEYYLMIRLHDFKWFSKSDEDSPSTNMVKI